MTKREVLKRILGKSQAWIMLLMLSGVLATPCFGQAKEGALSFASGKNDFVRIPADASLDVQVFTLDLWVLRRSPTLDQHCAFFRGAKGVGMANGLVLTYGYDDQDAWTVFVGGYPVTGRSSHSLGEWAHIAVTYDGNEIKLFQDGLLQAQANHSVELLWDSDIYLGVELDCEDGCMDPNQALAGCLDQVNLWSKPRTREEIVSSMKGRAPQDPAHLVGSWCFQEVGGTVAYDGSGFENHGILGSFRTTGPDADARPRRVWIDSRGGIEVIAGKEPVVRTRKQKSENHRARRVHSRKISPTHKVRPWPAE